MKIGIDVRLWSESGVGRYTRNLIKNLQVLDKKNEYVLFALSKDKQEILNQVQNDNFRILRVDIRWHTVEEQFKLPSIINIENLDLVHFPYFSVPIFYNKPFVVTIHDLILDHFPTGEASTLPLPVYKLKQLGYQFVIKQAAKKAKKVITVSKATKNEIVDHLGIDENKVVVTYEGIDNKLSSKFKVQSSKLDKDYFLYVGNAYPHKNLERLLKAFSTLNSQLSTLKLILVGKEDYFYKRLKQKVRDMGLENSVVFYGEVNDEELIQLYRGAKALIIPSLMEGFGLPGLEAMVNKCLVLCSDIPVFREIYKDVAIYFDPYKVKEIEKVLNDICYHDLNHDNKIKMGIERVRDFSWRKMAEETLKLYESSFSAGSE